MFSLGESLLPLLLASALGAIVGLERELHGRPAGLRTHILLSLGAAMFGMMSHGLIAPNVDPTRIAAQVVTGIGFIGAGTILHLGGTVRGLTTAASIWTTAAIGLAVGLDRRFWVMASLATVLTFLTLALVHLLENRLKVKRRLRDIEIIAQEGKPVIEPVLNGLASLHVEVSSVRSLPALIPHARRYELSLEMPAQTSTMQVLGTLMQCEGILEVKWD
ncbi:MAG: MgtC/SapB family protein [Chthonomonadetes bacterium]|nr:MgtC/SapB family protein [Chthonomonadetes bacterium]